MTKQMQNKNKKIIEFISRPLDGVKFEENISNLYYFFLNKLVQMPKKEEIPFRSVFINSHISFHYQSM